MPTVVTLDYLPDGLNSILPEVAMQGAAKSDIGRVRWALKHLKDFRPGYEACAATVRPVHRATHFRRWNLTIPR